MGFYTRTKQPVIGNIAEAIGFDEETNTLEIGTNLYVDGNIITDASLEGIDIHSLLALEDVEEQPLPNNFFNNVTHYSKNQVLSILEKYKIKGFSIYGAPAYILNVNRDAQPFNSPFLIISNLTASDGEDVEATGAYNNVYCSTCLEFYEDDILNEVLVKLSEI